MSNTCILTGDNAFAKQTTFLCGVIKNVYLLYFQIAVIKIFFLKITIYWSLDFFNIIHIIVIYTNSIGGLYMNFFDASKAKVYI